MSRRFPVPPEEKETSKSLSLHEAGVRKLKDILEKQGYRTYRTPNFAGDLYACKDAEVIIVEVKKIRPGSFDMQPIIHGVGQLLYYDFTFRLEKESKGKVVRLWLAFPFNEELFKKFCTRVNYVEVLTRKTDPFLSRFQVRLMPIPMEKETWVYWRELQL
jgi:hypothetical protein